jgi:hypothetical protein
MGVLDDLFRVDRSALAALDTTNNKIAFLQDGGPNWNFYVDDYSAEIANGDPRYIAPDVDPTGASGAFIQANSMRAGMFWYDYGGRISREAGRLFVGAAADNDGRLTNTVTDWLTTAMHQGRNAAFQTTNTAQFASIQQIGQIAILAGTRASDINGKTSGTIGVASFAQSDSTYASTAYAFYGEAWKSADTPGTAQVYEGDIINLGSVVDINPYHMFADGLTVNLWVASGGEVSGAHSATAAIGIVNNGARYRKGIVFGALALEANGIAMELASGHNIQQVYEGGYFGSAISFCVNNAARQQALMFTNVGFLLHNSIGTNLIAVDVDSSYVNGLKVTPSAAGVGVTIAPAGSDTNIDLTLSGKGTGTVNLNNVAVSGSSGPLSAYGTVKVNNVRFKIPLYAI